MSDGLVLLDELSICRLADLAMAAERTNDRELRAAIVEILQRALAPPLMPAPAKEGKAA